MSNISHYVLEPKHQAVLIKSNFCILCGKPIEVGMIVVTKRSTCARLVYHERCALEIELIEEPLISDEEEYNA